GRAWRGGCRAWHLPDRRARLTAARCGGQVPAVDLAFTPAEEAFRAELRAWLAANVPSEHESPTLAEEEAFLREWQRPLHEGGWVGIHWPHASGGAGAQVGGGSHAPRGTVGTRERGTLQHVPE